MTKRKAHSPDFKTKVVLGVIREEMTIAGLSKKYGVHPTQIGSWKRAAIQDTLMMPGSTGCIRRSTNWLWNGIF
jgi:transposase-like protein